MIKARESLPIETLREMVAYDAVTGVLTWKARTPQMFVPSATVSAESLCAAWNAKYVGSPAVHSENGAGYRGGCITLRGRRIPLLAHRVAFALATGSWSKEDIDHINGARSDNRLCNLRQASRSENARNARLPSKNTSGHIGVRWHTKSGKWLAYICSQGSRKHLGVFTDIEDAVAARAAAEVEMGFHKNHGRHESRA